LINREIQQETTQTQRTEQQEDMRQEIPERPKTPSISEQRDRPQQEAPKQTGSDHRYHKKKRPSGSAALTGQQPTAPLQFKLQ
jgi:hypothetical protein